ncbi:MAG: PaaI family thioesterase [Burkholderiaceae bacterium]
MTEALAIGQRILQQQPFSMLIGAQLSAFSAGYAEIVVPVRDELKQQHGFVHGGVLSYAADNALTFAGGSALGVAVVTAEYKINYLRPALGERLIARAKVLHAGRSQAVCRCDLFMVDGGDERLCAVAQGTISRIGEPSGSAGPSVDAEAPART